MLLCISLTNSIIRVHTYIISSAICVYMLWDQLAKHTKTNKEESATKLMWHRDYAWT